MQKLEIPTGQLSSLLSRLKRAGGDEKAALEHIGLAQEALSNPMAPVLMRYFDALNAHGEAWCSDPLFALHAGIHTDGVEFHTIRFALASQPTVHDLLKLFIEFAAQVVSPVSFTLAEEEGSADLKIVHKMPPGTSQQVYLEFVFGLVLAPLRIALGEPIRLKKVHMGHAPRHHKKNYREAFGVEVSFNAGCYGIGFFSQTLDMPLKEPDPVLANLSLDALSKFTADRSPKLKGFSEVVLGALELVEDHEGWCLSAIARKLQLPPRSLQHRIAQCGTTFQSLVDQVRKEKAGRMLDIGQTQSEIAYQLGYADEGSLRKAFQRWYGMPPGEWRKGH